MHQPGGLHETTAASLFTFGPSFSVPCRTGAAAPRGAFRPLPMDCYVATQRKGTVPASSGAAHGAKGLRLGPVSPSAQGWTAPVPKSETEQAGRVRGTRAVPPRSEVPPGSEVLPGLRSSSSGLSIIPTDTCKQDSPGRQLGVTPPPLSLLPFLLGYVLSKSSVPSCPLASLAHSHCPSPFVLLQH